MILFGGEEGLSSQSFEGHTESKRATPKINGSLGAFIAVVVCLTIFIIVACIGVFFLLREQRTYNGEQGHHRSRTRYRNTSETQGSTYEGPTHKKWKTRLVNLFGRIYSGNSTRNTGQIIMKRGDVHGWVQAGSGDDWDSNSGQDGRLGVRELSPPSPSIALTTPPISSSPISRPESISSVRFDLYSPRSLHFPDRHPSPHPTLPNIHSQLSSPSYSPTSSPVPLSIPEESTSDSDIRHFSTSSGVVMQTFPGGTKFMEAF